MLVGLGLIATGVAVIAAGLKLKFMLGLLFAVPFAVLLLGLRTEKQFITVFLFLLALSLPMNFDLLLFWRRHVGGAAGVHISGSLLSALGLWTVALYMRLLRRSGQLSRINLLQAVAVLSYMVTGVLSLTNAVFPGLVGLELLRLSMLLFIMLAVMNLRDIAHLRVFIFALSISMLIQAALAAAQHFTGRSLGLQVFGEFNQLSQNIGFQFIRPTGTTGHPNTLAYFFETTVPIMLAASFAVHGKWRRLWYLFATICGFGALILTLSRAAWITVPISLTFVLFVLGRRHLFRLRSGLIIFMVGIVVFSAGIYTIPIIYKRFTYNDYGSSDMRMPLNRGALNIIGQYPVFGVGMNNYSEVYRSYDKTTFSRKFTEKVYRGSYEIHVPFRHVVHNLYLMIWAEVGTVGLIAFLSMFVTTFFMAWRCYVRGPPWIRAITVGIVAGLVAHLAHAMVDPGFPLMFNIATMIFCLFGFIGAGERLGRAKTTSMYSLTDSPKTEA